MFHIFCWPQVHNILIIHISLQNRAVKVTYKNLRKPTTDTHEAMQTPARVINLDSGAMGPPAGYKIGDVEGNFFVIGMITPLHGTFT